MLLFVSPLVLRIVSILPQIDSRFVIGFVFIHHPQYHWQPNRSLSQSIRCYRVQAMSRLEGDRGRTQHVATVVAAPVAIPVRDDSFINGSRAGTQQPARPTSSSYSRENFGRMMSALSTGERGGVSRHEASRSDTARGVRPPEGVNTGAGGGRVASGQVDDRISCRLCGGVLYAPKGFDLALLDCPHCHRPMA